MSDTPKPPPVVHACNCVCARCVDARRDELRRRLEERRRDQRRADMAYIEEQSGRGLVFAPPKKPQPGTRAAIVRRYGRVS